MKNTGLVIILLIAVFINSNAQQSISKSTEEIIKASALQAAEKYTSYVELMAMETDKNEIKIHKAELLKYVDRDSIFVFNDLIPKEDRPPSLKENIDPLLTYLDDITSRYNQGALIKFENFQVTSIYIDQDRQRLFTKVVADRSLDGMYTYKNETKKVENKETINFYISISFDEAGLPECKIYSILLHPDNAGEFHEIKVVEKTAPIVFREFENEKSVFKRKSEHTIKWEGGELYERLSVDIYRMNGISAEHIMSIDSSLVNDNTLTFFLPTKIKSDKTKIKPGKKNLYYFQIRKLSTEEDPVKSDFFFVKRKTPLLIKIGAPVLVAAGVYYYIDSSQPKPEVPAEGAPGLPDTKN